MLAWRCNAARPEPGLHREDVERPQPGPGELLIEVHAAGVTSSELMWYPTTHQKSGAPRFQAIPGHEFSGVVAAAGAGADFAIGQAVFGMNDWFADGATAEYCCTASSAVAAKPERLTRVEAASVPISALTAWQGLFDRAELRPGERVLIHGGSGGVGVFAIQLAKQHGAEVLATASSRHHERLKQLGADQVIDYHNERFEDAAGKVDVVFDAVGGATLQRSWDVLSPDGRLVTIATVSETDDDSRTKNAFFIVEPRQQQLVEIAGRLARGQLQPVVGRVVSFDKVAEAYARPSKSRSELGKTVLDVIQKDNGINLTV